MSWQNELEALRTREAFAEELGGTERVKRQKDGGLEQKMGKYLVMEIK